MSGLCTSLLGVFPPDAEELWVADPIQLLDLQCWTDLGWDGPALLLLVVRFPWPPALFNVSLSRLSAQCVFALT